MMPYRTFAFGLLFVFAAVSPVFAQPTYTWTAPASGNWNSAGNWDANGAPVSAVDSTINFGGTTAYTATNNIGPMNFNVMNFSGSGAKTVASSVVGNSLNLSGTNAAINVASGSGATTISSNLNYTVNSTITNNSTNALNLTGSQLYSANTTTTYAGTGNIGLSATAVLSPSLSFANGASIVYTGSGTLAVGPQGVSAAVSSLNTITFANNGTYNFTNGVSGGGSTGNLSMGDNASGGANTTILYNAASGVTLNFANFSSGLLTVGNFGNLAGTVSINAGTVRFGIVGGTANTGGDLFGANLTLNVASGATFDFNGNAEGMGAISGAGRIIGANITMGLTGNRTWGGDISGSVAFSTGATGVNYTFTSANTSTATTTTVAGSSLSLGNGGTTGSVTGALANAGTLNFNRSNALNITTIISGVGTINQIGFGTTTLSGNNTFTGNVNVSAGTLAFASATALPTGSLVVTANGGVLDLSAISGGYTFGTGRTLTAGRTGTASNDVLGNVTVGGTLNVSGTGTAGAATFRDNLTLSGSTVRFDLSNNPSSGNDLAGVGGNLTLSGTNTIQVNQLNGVLVSGDYTLFNYTGSLTGNNSNLTLGGLAGGTTRQTFALNTGSGSNSAITLNVAGSPENLTWTGGTSSTWDLVTTAGNFSGPADTRFYNLDSVAFGDTGAGTITLAGTLQPTAVTVNSSQDYTFSGTGSIAGSASLTKSGNGSLTIGTANTYIGVTTLNAGILTFASGGSIAGPVTVAGGTLNANIANAIGGTLTVSSGTVNASVANSILGTLTVTGGTVNGSVANSLSATANINGGTVTVGSLTAFSATANIGLNGGTLAVTGNSGTSATQIITVGSNGGTINVADTFVMSVLGTQLIGPGTTLIKTGGGTLSVGSSGTSTVGTINVNDGTFRLTSNRVGSVNAINVANGASLYLLDTTSFTTATPFALATNGTITLNGSGYNNQGAYYHTLDEATSANAGINTAIVLASTSTFNLTALGRATTDTVTDTFAQAISGPGGLIKIGEGTMILATANTYSGTTTINGGTLQLGAAGTINSTPAIAVGTGATYNVTAVTGGYTLGSANAQTLSGTGTIVGAVTVGSQGVIRAGNASADGTLTLGNNLTIGSGGTLSTKLASTSSTANSLAIGGTFAFDPAGKVRIDANNVTLDPATTYTYTLGTSATSTSGLNINNQSVFSFANFANSGDYSYALTGNANGDILLTFTPVPEPSLMIAVGAGLLGAGAWTRRRFAGKRAVL